MSKVSPYRRISYPERIAQAKALSATRPPQQRKRPTRSPGLIHISNVLPNVMEQLEERWICHEVLQGNPAMPVPNTVGSDGGRYRCAVLEQTPCDLATFGVDRPYLRLKKTYDHLHAWHRVRMAELRRDLRELLLYFRVERNARSGAGRHADASDLADAMQWFRATFIPTRPLRKRGAA
ncbi:MAG: hypothetical protein GIW99_00265 [Candidatus Eremiobacteraeota bacterium]|nr:hypothetical protein [Candidatus Eremiobacteraeota bacterium]MBC5826120.1 hypothetical protein [Candidatus Eremiobacteraeota bacterium]